MNIIENNIEKNVFFDTNEDDDIKKDNYIKKNYEPVNQNKLDLSTMLKRPPSCGLIIVDNFYNNAMDTRNYILTQEFSVKGNFPGQRTVSYANEHLKEIIQKYVEPFAGKITEFPLPKSDNSDADKIYNGAFQYTLANDKSWIHTDKWNNWAGVLFMTPNAPLCSGTSFYRFKDGTMCQEDTNILKNEDDINRFNQDLSKWDLVDRVGNIFNRLILFNANRYHISDDYFGDTKENGRLFQVFFFSTER
jgi:hypothetical protein